MIHLIEIALPFIEPISTAYGTIDTRPTVLVGVEEGGIVGWGEAAPFPGADPETVGDIWTAFEQGGPLPPTAAAALDSAWHDHAARRDGVTLRERVGGGGAPPSYSMAIGVCDAPATLTAVNRAMTLGCEAVKIKVAGRRGAGRVATVTATFPQLTVGVDANGSLETDAAVIAYERGGAAYIEQPFATDDLAAHARTRTYLETAEIVLDESIRDLSDVELALGADSADRFCLKPGRVGITKALLMGDMAARQGVGIKASGMFDSAIGRAGVVALAGLPGARFSDTAPAGAYFSHDVGSPEAGRPGIGFDPDPGSLEVRATSVMDRGTVSP